MHLTFHILLTLLMLLLCGIGYLFGMIVGRLPEKKMQWIMFAAILLLFWVATPVRYPHLNAIPVFGWLHQGWTSQLIFAVLVPFLFTATGYRSDNRQLRFLWGVLGVIFLFLLSGMDISGPLISNRQLAKLETSLDPDGVCLQSNSYTCGPAAAVTLLRRMGIEAEEGSLSIQSGTSAVSGTTVNGMVKGIQSQGPLTCQVSYPETLKELAEMGEVLVLTKYATLVDHWVVLLEVREQDVLIADPLRGLRELSHAQFADLRRRTTIEVTFSDKNHPTPL